MAKSKTDNSDAGGELSTVVKSQAQQSQGMAVAFQQTPENIQLLKDTLASADTNLSDNELGLFLYQANKTGLDPLARQIYVMKSGSKVSFMTSIDGQRLVAQRTGEYEGQTSPEWCGPDGKWKEVWLDDKPPAASRVGVYRKGMREPVYGVATWKSYNQGRGVWLQKSDVMIAKCAEALALRKAFPQELSGLYTPEEMNENNVAADDRPKPMSFQEAIAAAGKSLTEKGIDNRDDVFAIIFGIAGVSSVQELRADRLGAVLETIAREPIEDLRKLYLPDNGIIDGEGGISPVVTPPRPAAPEAEVMPPKPLEQAMSDGDAMPPNFLKKDDVVPVTDAQLDAVTPPVAAEPEPAGPQYAVPDYKQGSPALPRPEMRTLTKKWLTDYGLTKPGEIETFYKNAIGKKAPASFDDFVLVLSVLADELNAKAKQATLV